LRNDIDHAPLAFSFCPGKGLTSPFAGSAGGLRVRRAPERKLRGGGREGSGEEEEWR